MEKPRKEVLEDDVLAAILKVKPTEEMPRPSKKKSEKSGEKPLQISLFWLS